MKISVRLILLSAIFIVVAAVLIGLSVRNLGSLNNEVKLIVEDRVVKVKWANNVIDAINVQARALRNIMLIEDDERREIERNMISEQSTIIQKYVDSLTATITTEQGVKLLQEFEKNRKDFVDARAQCLDLAMLHTPESDALAEELLFTVVEETQEHHFKDIGNLIAYQEQLLDESAMQSNETYQSSLRLMLIIGGVAIILIVILSIMIIRSITRPIKAAGEVANKIAKGDMNVQIDDSKKDETGETMKAMKKMVQSITSLINDVNDLSGKAMEGKLDTRADDSKYEGEYASLVAGINGTLDAVISPLNVTAEYVDRISKGDMPPKITDDYKGDFNEIKNNLNLCIDSIQLLISDSNKITAEMSKSNLRFRAEESRHNGDFREIIAGTNASLERMTGFLDNVPAPLMAIDNDFNVMFMNKAGADLDNKSALDVERKKCFDHFKTDQCQTNDCACHVTMNTKQKTTHTTVAKPGGKRLDIEYTGVPIYDDEGAVTGAFEIVVDQTDIKNVLGKAEKVSAYMSEETKKIMGLLTEVSQGKIDGVVELDAPDEDTADSHETLNGVLKGVQDVQTWLSGLIDYVTKIANGDMSAHIEKASERDQIHEWLILMRDNIKKLVDDADFVANAAAGGKLGTRVDAEVHQGAYKDIIQGFNGTLDTIGNAMNTSANIMIGDIHRNITYLNKSAHELFRLNEAEIRKTLPEFRADTIIGQNIDKFHKNPAHNKGILDNLNGTHSAQISLGDMIFRLNITPMKDAEGVKIGYVVEWFDNTNQARFENELQTVIKEMTEGIWKTRLDLSGLDGMYKDTANDINNMLDNILHPIEEGNRVLKLIRGGNLRETVDLELKGDHKALQDAVNGVHEWLTDLIDYVTKIANGDLTADIDKASDQDQIHQWLVLMRDNIKALVKDVNLLAKAAVDGELKKRADETDHKGDFRKIVKGINETLDSVIAPVNEAAAALTKMSRNDLTVSMSGDFRGDHAILKNSLNNTLDAINDILGSVASTVEEVNRGALQVSDASGALSQGATESAASLEEITSSMAELGSQTKLNAENANQANILTNDARDAAEKGFEEMIQLNDAMTDITESSKNISKIIKVIDEIAFQTNLLALNAAVEAARAGRHGKGFAVVAEEVRNLAARSASAAKETAELIENSIKTVENGSSLADKTGKALEEIKNGAIKAADIVGEITTSSNEQAQGIAQINEGLSQIDKVTQTNTASAEESASAAEELSGQAAQLKDMISKFKLRSVAVYDDDDDDDYSSMMIESSRNQAKKLPEKKKDHRRESKRETSGELNPEDIINLDEDDFGKY